MSPQICCILRFKYPIRLGLPVSLCEHLLLLSADYAHTILFKILLNGSALTDSNKNNINDIEDFSFDMNKILKFNQ